jgi:hypothetical protein
MTNINVQCFIRDKWKCRCCGFSGALHCHHIKFRSHGGTDNLNNLICLCNSCHSGLHIGHLKLEVMESLENDNVIKFTRKGNWSPE